MVGTVRKCRQLRVAMRFIFIPFICKHISSMLMYRHRRFVAQELEC